MSWLLLLLGCTGEVEPPPDTADSLSWGWNDTASLDREDVLSSEEIKALLSRALTHLHTLDGTLILDPFEDFMNTVAEAGCPSILSATNYTDINGDCTTTAGIQLFMDIRWIRDEASTSANGTETLVEASLGGEAVAVEGTEILWSSSTIISLNEKISPSGTRNSYARLAGSVSVPDVDGWPGENLSLALIQDWYTESDGITPMAVALRGGAGMLQDPSLAAYSFLDLSLWTEAGGGPCSIEPAGAVELHTQGGGRYLIVFDGVDPTVESSWTEAEQCDGMAEIFYFGESLGEHELDLSPLMDWEERPW